METIKEEKEGEYSDKEKIQIILGQTNLNEEEASERLEFFEGDYIIVIKDWMGILSKKTQTNTTSKKSINQEMFRQMRLNFSTQKSHAQDQC